MYSLHIKEDFKTLHEYAFKSKDYAVTPGSPWNYAIKLNKEDFVVVEKGITKGVPPFSNDGAPVQIKAKVWWGGCSELAGEWGVIGTFVLYNFICWSSLEGPLRGVLGIRDICEKIVGMRDTEGKNYRDTGYLEKKNGDIQPEV